MQEKANVVSFDFLRYVPFVLTFSRHMVSISFRDHFELAIITI